MNLPEGRISDRTQELINRQPGMLEESQPVKAEARRALSLMSEIIGFLSKAEIDLALLIDSNSRRDS